MHLPERTMSNSEQVAYLVTLCHEEWLSAELRGQEEYNFDEYLGFIAWAATRISSERSSEMPL